MNTEIVIIGFLLCYIVFLNLQSWYERKNLLDRLIARDLPELASIEIQRKRATIPSKISQVEGFEV